MRQVGDPARPSISTRRRIRCAGWPPRLGVTKPVITRALDTMGALKLVSRHRDERDKRNVLVKRTVEGALLSSASAMSSSPRRRSCRFDRPRPPPARLPARSCRRQAARRGRRRRASSPAGRRASPSPVADSAQAPRPDAGLNTQLLLGDDVRVFEEAEGWAWVQAERDGYVGYVADAVLGEPRPASRRMSSRRRAPSSIPART